MYASSEKKLEILNDHYKDTFSHLVIYRKQRDRLLLYLLTVVVIMFLDELFPEEIIAAISEVVLKKTQVNIVPDFFILILVSMLPLIAAAILAQRYWQVWQLIESQYDYLEKLEAELTSFFSSGIPFTRESNFSYKENRNISIWSSKIYNWYFSLLFTFLFFLGTTSGLRHDGFSWDWFMNFIIWIILFLFWHFKIMRHKQY